MSNNSALFSLGVILSSVLVRWTGSMLIQLALVVSLLFMPLSMQAAEKGPAGVIRVGIFPNAPFNFLDGKGIAQGLIPDLLREIVRDEDWAVDFVPGSWAECLERLQKQEIDLMISVAYSPERGEIMDYTHESVAELWGQVFVRPEDTSKNIADFSGQRIGIMRQDISGSNFIKTAEQLGVTCEIKEYASHAEVLAAVQKREIDAGVVHQHYGLRHAGEYGIVGSTILFSPFSIYFASKRGTQHALLSHIDACLFRWKQDKNSFYHQRLNHWMAQNHDHEWAVPIWLSYGVFPTIAIILVLVGLYLVWKKTLAQQTKDLQKKEATLKAIHNASEDAIYLINPNGTVVTANKATEVQLQRPPELIIGWDVTSFFPEHSSVLRKKYIQKVIETGEPVIFQDQPENFTFESHLYPVLDKTGKVRQVAIFSKDITEQKRTEAYREMGSEVLHIINDSAIFQDSIQRILDVLKTRTGFDAVGIRLQDKDDFPYVAQEGFPQEFLALENTLVMHSPDGEVCKDEDGNVMLAGTCGLVISGKKDPVDPFFTKAGSFWVNDSSMLLNIPLSTDSRFCRRNQCIFHNFASIALVPIRNKEKIVGLLHFSDHRKDCFTANSVAILEGIASHIGTAVIRKLAEEALQAERKQLNDIIGFLPDATFAIDKERRVIIWNKAMEKMTGLSAAEMIGKGDFAYAIPFYGEARQQLIDLIFDDNTAIAALYPHITHDDDTLITEVFCKALYNNKGAWVFAKASPLHDQSGNIIGAIESIRDITESKETEEEKRKLLAQLIQAQKMEAIGTLAGGIAHDFNNLLGAILGYTDMAQAASPSGSATSQHLDKVLEAGNRAANLVKQILTFSRQTNNERLPLKLPHIAKEAVKLLRPTLPSTIAIRLQIDSAIQPILADPNQVHQILMNLCTNAFHAMEQTGGILTITLKDVELDQADLTDNQNEAQPGKFVALSIRDSGTGIPPEIRKKMFDPYFTTKEVGKGTGMGLAIVHGIVKSYGGFITCESEPGKGTVFHIFFPAIEQEVTPEIKPVEIIPIGKEHVLLIDDENILAEMGKSMLEGLGYEVTALTSSLEALAIFQKQPDRFDVVITDQTMPSMTGMDLARRILEIRPGIPIILCTGYSTLISEEQIKAEGIKEFVMKPLTRNILAALVRRILDEG